MTAQVGGVSVSALELPAATPLGVGVSFGRPGGDARRL
jgi:hypothetical protein